jgi:aldehyde dehydrogenase (NAD(P)+)
MHEIDATLARLDDNKRRWARTSLRQRIEILEAVKANTLDVAAAWAETASDHKQIPAGSPLRGEEWLSGPYVLISACNGLIETLSKMDGKAFLDDLDITDVGADQVAVRVVPHSIWDRLLLSGISARIWMQPGVTRENLANHTAGAYDTPAESRDGSLSLVLGAGNISSIAPLDCFEKLFSEHSAVVLKLNPVNDYLLDVFEKALAPLIDFGALAIVTGGLETGEYLCNHPAIESIHITGAESSHDAIVWGVGEEGAANKRAGTPRNTRPITSELGAVCPTIIVPGRWTKADVRFQAEQIATQKLHNSGFNCVACQMLIVPADWEQKDEFLAAVKDVMTHAPRRGLYYPGANERIDEFVDAYPDAEVLRGDADTPRCVVVPHAAADGVSLAHGKEVFAPVLNTLEIEGDTAEQYLRSAIDYCNEKLHGTLGANVVVDPATRRDIAGRWNDILSELRYGCIAVNGWTGLGFLSTQVPWGAYPGHTLDDVQSGIGFVHNTCMFDNVQKTVVEAPFRPFPRNLLHGSFTLLPRPPWFVTHKRAAEVGRLLTAFQFKPGWLRLPRIFYHALLG